jgi:hypothetical protein
VAHGGADEHSLLGLAGARLQRGDACWDAGHAQGCGRPPQLRGNLGPPGATILPDHQRSPANGTAVVLRYQPGRRFSGPLADITDDTKPTQASPSGVVTQTPRTAHPHAGVADGPSAQLLRAATAGPAAPLARPPAERALRQARPSWSTGCRRRRRRRHLHRLLPPYPAPQSRLAGQPPPSCSWRGLQRGFVCFEQLSTARKSQGPQ